MENLTMNTITISVLLLLFLTQFSTSFSSATAKGLDGLNNSTKSSALLGNHNNSGLMMPVESTVYRVYDYNYGYNHNNEQGEGLQRRKLEPFQLCLECKCCAAGGATDPSTCTTLACCFGIDCQIPGKPFGVCAFVPKTCNCTSCAG